MQRNLRDSLDYVPTIEVDLSDHEPITPPRSSRRRQPHFGYGLLWLLLLLQSAVMGAGGWWGWQQIEHNKQQLADSQHNLARINEQFAVRLQNINGKLVSTESTVNTGSATLRQQISQLSERFDKLQSELQKQQSSQKIQSTRQDTLEKQLTQLVSTSKAQVDGVTELSRQLGAQGRQLTAYNQQISAHSEALAVQKNAQNEVLATLQKLGQSLTDAHNKLGQISQEVTSVRGVREQLGGLPTLASNISSLQKQVQQARASISRLEREQLALKVGQENRASVAAPSSSAEFDAFRAQITRSINSLQSQMQRLQQQAAKR